MNRSERFVADGGNRIRQTPEFKAACLDITQSVRQEYTAEMDRASPLCRLMLRARMKREIRTRIEQMAPKDAHFLSGD